MTNTDTAASPSDIFGARLRHLRKLKRLSVEALAARCKEGGSPELTANAIYSIENGRRKDGVRTRHVTVEELLALACALEVTPFALLMPTEPGEYRVLSDRAVGSDRVFDWLGGGLDSPFGDAPVAAGQYPAGLPEWLLERLRKLDAESDAERAEKLAELNELGMRSNELVAELNKKSADQDAFMSRLEETQARFEAELEDLKRKTAEADAILSSAAEATAAAKSADFELRAAEIAREAIERVLAERSASD